MVKKILLIVTLCILGCRQIEVQLPNGNTVRYTNFLNNTKIGRMEISAPSGEKLIVENMDSESKALDVAAAAINKVP